MNSKILYCIYNWHRGNWPVLAFNRFLSFLHGPRLNRDMALSVCVIGAGAAGLCAARLLAASARYHFSVFELSSQVGGTWVYTDRTGPGIHSSMYKNLRTNIPKEIMSFPDFPFPDGGKSFIHHSEVLRYLRDYAKHYELHQHIRFRTAVRRVDPEVTDNGKITWMVTVEDLVTRNKETLCFDAVIVCNGHYADPLIPHVEDLEVFGGHVCHSHDYREPEPYRGQRVALLGAASSGVDISLELSAVADQIYLCHNLPETLDCELPNNVEQRPGLTRALQNGFVLMDGSTIEVDAVIFCTGYLYRFPFMSGKCKVQTDGHRVQPLYKHLIHMDMPSIAFVGIPFTVIPFPLFHYQIAYFLKVLEGKVQLPGRQEMEEEVAQDLTRRLDLRMPERYAHKMGCLQWEYFSDLAGLAGIPDLPPAVRNIYDETSYKRKTSVMHYKNDNYNLSAWNDKMVSNGTCKMGCRLSEC